MTVYALWLYGLISYKTHPDPHLISWLKWWTRAEQKSEVLKVWSYRSSSHKTILWWTGRCDHPRRPCALNMLIVCLIGSLRVTRQNVNAATYLEMRMLSCDCVFICYPSVKLKTNYYCVVPQTPILFLRSFRVEIHHMSENLHGFTQHLSSFG